MLQDRTATWDCPGCGAQVPLPQDGALGGLGDDRLDALAHALCGCYVLEMSDSLLGRLFAAVLGAGGPDEDTERPIEV